MTHVRKNLAIIFFLITLVAILLLADQQITQITIPNNGTTYAILVGTISISIGNGLGAFITYKLNQTLGIK